MDVSLHHCAFVRQKEPDEYQYLEGVQIYILSKGLDADGRRWPVGVVWKICMRRVRVAYLMDESSVISVKNISMKGPTSDF